MVTRIDYPDGSYETWSGFNQYGQATVHRLRNGAQVQTTYDSMGRVSAVSNPRHSGSTYWTTYAYYPSSHVWANRLKSVTDPGNDTTTYEYDRKFVNDVQGSVACSGRGLVTKIINPDGTSKSFGYSPRGEKLWEEDELGNRTSYVYDAYGRILQMTDPLNRTTYTQYGDTEAQALTQVFSAPRRVISPSGRITAYLYDDNKRTTLMAEGDWSSDSKYWLYEYDAVGNKTKTREMVEKSPNVYRDTSYEYDSRNRLVKQTAPLGRVTQWQYDAVGNVTKVINPDNTNTRKSYNSMNQVTYSWDEMNQRTSYSYSKRHAKRLDIVLCCF
ncbi:hypothetical protein MLD52_22835 [Puniceicoccaceae bacterium K14]|nr:hypothetical protein [Puniceicoccaceae bacterium K14]